MKNKIIKIFVISLIILSFSIIPLYGCNEGEETQEVKNIILLIGDGMGVNHIESTKIYQEISELNMETLPYDGLVNTTSLGGLVTDSAAAGTAMATGQKVVNANISWYNGNNLKTFTEYSIENNKKTGIVTTKPLYDATPAAFSSHTMLRTDEIGIRNQQIESGIDVFLGEGKEKYDALSEQIAIKGYDYITTEEQLNGTINRKIFGAFESLTPTGSLTLAELSDKAIETLNENNTEGFFLMIEGGKIDSMSHSNDFDAMTEELKAFDLAVKVALDFAKEDGNTMVIVTADHETGDLILPDNPTKENLNDDCYNSTGHTAKKVKYFAYGGISDTIGKEIENTDIFVILMKAFKIES